MKSRRKFLLAGALCAIAPALAQPRQKIGFLLAVPLTKSVLAPAVVARLEERGYRDGKTSTFVYRSADGMPDRFPKLARELVDAKCDLIFAIGPEHAARALQAATRSIPVVFFANDYDPLRAQVVRNLGRPGANITGVYVPEPELVAKRLQLIREALPAARRVLVFSDPFSADQLSVVRSAAQAAALDITVVEFSKPPYDLTSALERVPDADALMVMTSPALFAELATLRTPLLRRRLPSIGTAGYADRGILFGFGAVVASALRRAADVGVEILKGASPASIPVEQPREYDFVINANVARQMGLKIPEAVLARATRIVE
jgi:putative tryptophan/tyrosine transport system substrate-binding protein